jgi:hypothetical protein
MRRNLIFIAVLAVGAILALSWRYTITAVVGAYRFARDTVADYGLRAVKAFSGHASASMPRFALMQACAYVQRLVKRERPVISGQWRMVPST